MIYNQLKSSFIFHLLLIVTLLSANPLFSQNKKQTDSLIRITSLEIYKNPDKAIRIGNQIVKNAIKNEDIDFTIKGYKLISDSYSSK